MNREYDALALFSGGLDSILSCLVVKSQGLRVLGLHFTSPFFGHPGKISRWREMYSLDIIPVDVGDAYVDMLRSGPRYGFGKCMNPCVDCKILMLSRARELLAASGARFIISGEVLGQRPMSQRRDALNAIRNEAGVKGLLLRPLSARLMEPTLAETEGLVDRERLLDISGRGRTRQLELAARYGVTEIPAPGGGCRLTEKESVRRFWPLLNYCETAAAEHFVLANVGRQLWAGPHWLVVGRNQADNKGLEALRRDTDVIIYPNNFSGALGLMRSLTPEPIPARVLRDAAATVASYAPRARALGDRAELNLCTAGRCEPVRVTASMATATAFREPPAWVETRDEFRTWAKERGAGEGA